MVTGTGGKDLRKATASSGKPNTSKQSNKKTKDAKDKKKKAAKKTKTPEKKKKVEKKTKKKDSDSSSSKSDKSAKTNKTVDPPSDPSVTLKHPSAPKEPLPGALQQAPPNPDGYFLRLMKEERPDLFSPNCTVDAVDAEQLDAYLRDKNELAYMDFIHVEDNFNKEDRDYARYQIEKKVNEGRYSALYLVSKQFCKDNEKTQDKSLIYMLKMPLRKNSATAAAKLKRELQILKELNMAKLTICPALVEFGKVCGSPFIVTSFLDINLEKMREMQRGRVNGPTAIYIGLETLNCLYELHTRNYVHNDVKPANFCLGIGAQDRKILIIDFGDTVIKGRRIQIPPPDGLTLPYMSIDHHMKTAAKDKSDIESWYYMLIDFLQPELINWKNKTTEAEVEALKKQFWKGISIDSGMNDIRIQTIGEIISTKTTMDKEDYAKMKQFLTIAMDAQLGGSKFVPQWIVSTQASCMKPVTVYRPVK